MASKIQGTILNDLIPKPFKPFVHFSANQLGSATLTVSPPKFLCTSSLPSGGVM